MKQGARYFRYLIFFVITTILISACSNQNVQEKLYFFKEHQWAQNNKPWLKLTVDDTTCRYNMIAVIRHTATFKYNELLVNFSYIESGDSAITQKISIPLGTERHWAGDTLGTVIETRVKINTQPIQFKSGEHSFIFQQLMPDDPLKSILNIGIRLVPVK